jgi:hypothetical protein
VLLFGQGAHADPTITVSPAVDLADNQTVTVTVSGFPDEPGAITECNNATGQPTILVAGNQVPVSCTNPLNNLQNVSGGGFAGKPFTIHAGTVGPPAAGADSAGKDAAADAALYPCPPTPAQAAAGATCVIAFGNAGGQQAPTPITFKANPISPAIGVTTTVPASPGPTNSAAAGTSTTPTTVATSVLGAQFQPPSASDGGAPPPGEVARTGPNDYLAPLAIAGFVVLDLGYLIASSTWSPRRRRRHEGVVPRA